MDAEEGDSFVRMESADHPPIGPSLEAATGQLTAKPHRLKDSESGQHESEAANSEDRDVIGTLSNKLARSIEFPLAGRVNENGADVGQESLGDDQVAPAASKKGFLSKLRLPTLGKAVSEIEQVGQNIDVAGTPSQMNENAGVGQESISGDQVATVAALKKGFLANLRLPTLGKAADEIEQVGQNMDVEAAAIPLPLVGRLNEHGTNVVQETIGEDQVAMVTTPKKGFLSKLRLPNLGKAVSEIEQAGQDMGVDIAGTPSQLVGRMNENGADVVQESIGEDQVAPAVAPKKRFLANLRFSTLGKAADEIEQVGQNMDVEAAGTPSQSVGRMRENIVNVPTSPTLSTAPQLPRRSAQAHLDSPEFASANQMFSMKKLMVQGMMDFAFLSANANQLRLILNTAPNAYYREPGIVMIAISIAFQVLCGFILAFLAFYDYHRQAVDKVTANRLILILNYVTVTLVFTITVLNVFIAAFGIGSNNIPSNTPNSNLGT